MENVQTLSSEMILKWIKKITEIFNNLNSEKIVLISGCVVAIYLSEYFLKIILNISLYMLCLIVIIAVMNMIIKSEYFPLKQIKNLLQTTNLSIKSFKRNVIAILEDKNM